MPGAVTPLTMSSFFASIDFAYQVSVVTFIRCMQYCNVNDARFAVENSLVWLLTVPVPCSDSGQVVTIQYNTNKNLYSAVIHKNESEAHVSKLILANAWLWATETEISAP